MCCAPEPVRCATGRRPPPGPARWEVTVHRRSARITGALSIVLVGSSLAGCGKEEPTRAVIPPPRALEEVPAAAAGGICRLLDYPSIEETTGVRFDVSAAGTHRDSNTCVLRSETADRPELALSVTKTKVDATVFKEEMTPRGGKSVSGLGKAAYRVTLAPGKDHGAGVEVGWLTGDGQMAKLRYLFPVGEDRAAADAFASKVVALAKTIDIGRR